MKKKYKGLIVTFDNKILDPTKIVELIKIIKGVEDVTLSEYTSDDVITIIQNEKEIKRRLFEFTKNFLLEKD